MALASVSFVGVTEEQPMLKHAQPDVAVAGKSEALKSAVITFDPDQIIRAICFHLLDHDRTTKILAISVYQTRDRLRRQHVRIMIARRQWEEMKNRERLDWLLIKSKTTRIYSDEVVSLASQTG
jgi:hypothetical protein